MTGATKKYYNDGNRVSDSMVVAVFWSGVSFLKLILKYLEVISLHHENKINSKTVTIPQMHPRPMRVRDILVTCQVHPKCYLDMIQQEKTTFNIDET